MVNVVSRREVKTRKPILVVGYNANMGGVDLKDGLLYHYSTARNRMKRFYMKIFRHLLDTTALNSFIAYKQLGGTKARVEFIISLAENVISTYKPIITIPISTAGRSLATIAKPTRLIGRHFPEYCPPSEKSVRPSLFSPRSLFFQASKHLLKRPCNICLELRVPRVSNKNIDPSRQNSVGGYQKDSLKWEEGIQ